MGTTYDWMPPGLRVLRCARCGRWGFYVESPLELCPICHKRREPPASQLVRLWRWMVR